MELELRALMPDDARAARALVARMFDSTRYASRVIEQLDAVLGFDDPEYLAFVAWHGTRCVGLTIFGTVTGACAITKLHAVVADDPEVRNALVHGIVQVCEGSRERMIVAELPDDAPFIDAEAPLRAAGFDEEGRVSDYFTDGIALKVLVRRLA